MFSLPAALCFGILFLSVEPRSSHASCTFMGNQAVTSVKNWSDIGRRLCNGSMESVELSLSLSLSCPHLFQSGPFVSSVSRDEQLFHAQMMFASMA